MHEASFESSPLSCEGCLEGASQESCPVRIRHPDGPDGAHRIEPGRKPRAIGVTQLQCCASGDEGDHPRGLAVGEYEERRAVWNIKIHLHREGLLGVVGSDLCT